MPPFRLAVRLKCLSLPLPKALARAREIGVSAVEFDARGPVKPQDLTPTALREIRKLLTDYELQVAAVEFQTRRGYGSTDELDRRVEATKAVMRMAHSLGAELVVNQVGQVPDDLASPEGQTLVEVLSDLGAYSQHAGAWLAAETGSESGADLRRLLDALPKGSLAVTLNPGNLIVNDHSPTEAVAALGDDIRHIRAIDGVRDLGRRRGTEVEVGRGSTDWPSLLGSLEEHGYRGSIAAGRENSDEPLVEIVKAVRYLSTL
jgi:sugar phosphate isomerase/epimerase